MSNASCQVERCLTEKPPTVNSLWSVIINNSIFNLGHLKSSFLGCFWSHFFMNVKILIDCSKFSITFSSYGFKQCNRSLTENTQTNISSYGLRLDFRFSLSACGLIPRAATGNRAHSGLAFHTDFRSTPKRRREENCPVKARSVSASNQGPGRISCWYMLNQ